MGDTLAAALEVDDSAGNALYTTLYSELHRLAQRQLNRSRDALNLGATTLLHEAYLTLAARNGPTFPGYAQFLGYAARVMRGLIINHAKNCRAQKRGGRLEITALDTNVRERVADERELTQISEALDELAKLDASLAEIVDLRFFCGFSCAEIGAMLGVSERTVQRNWEKARLYLHRAIRDPESLD
jgi:RNA polymerase sigma factor (TIGR02999 family)